MAQPGSSGAPGPEFLAIGDPVEVCPYCKEHELSLHQLGRLDGSRALIIGLADLGAERMARVQVTSPDKEKNGTWHVPLKCLKAISA